MLETKFFQKEHFFKKRILSEKKSREIKKATILHAFFNESCIPKYFIMTYKYLNKLYYINKKKVRGQAKGLLWQLIKAQEP